MLGRNVHIALKGVSRRGSLVRSDDELSFLWLEVGVNKKNGSSGESAWSSPDISPVFFGALWRNGLTRYRVVV